jgi:wingless-type MMTV integration site family protein 5
LREKYDEATQVKLNKRGRLQVKDPRYKVPSASDLVYLDESPDWCRNSRQLQWPGMLKHNYFFFEFLADLVWLICDGL